MSKVNLSCIFLLPVFISFDGDANELFSLNGDYELGMRTRYQSVSDSYLGDAQALTTRLTVAGQWHIDEQQQWQLLLKPNVVYALNEDHYNSVTVNRASAPIPDPRGFSFSQGFIAYDSNNNWQLSLGRKTLSFDNERMIGAVEFWQTPQSFDAFTWQYNNQENLTVQYVYSNKVRRIFGQKANRTLSQDDARYGINNTRPASELGEHQLSAHILHLAYQTRNNINLVGYHYGIENHELAFFSTTTTGLRISGEAKPAQLKYRYSAEFAWQQDRANNPYNYRAWYSLLEFGLQYKSQRLELSQEILSQDDYHGFITPLGTNHKFQGWADVFTSYGMQTGLRDRYMSYRGRKNKLNWRIVYHDYQTFSHSEKIGTEVEIELNYRANRQWEFSVIYAKYRSKNGLRFFQQANRDLSTWSASIAYNI